MTSTLQALLRSEALPPFFLRLMGGCVFLSEGIQKFLFAETLGHLSVGIPAGTLRFPIAAGVFVLTAVTFLSCSHTVTAPPEDSSLPIIAEFEIQRNPLNVLSVAVTTDVRHAAAVWAEYGTDSTSLLQSPAQPPGSVVPVLGLKPGTEYFVRVAASSAAGRETRSALTAIRTDTLPANIPALVVGERMEPAPGYVTAGMTIQNHLEGYAVIFNSTGSVVWYRKFDGSVVDFQKQPTGNYTACVATGPGMAQFLEVDNLGNVLRTYEAGTMRETDVHELRLLDGSFVLFGNEYETRDLRELGGLVDARVRGIVVEYHRPDAGPFVWRTLEHLEVTDAADNVSLTGQTVNPWHGNAIEIDHDGHLLVSFRHCDEITKIHSQTGEIIWRLGGRKNQFSFVNDPWNGFSHQHAIRRLTGGTIILFDNGNGRDPQESRAVEYVLDEATRTATLVWEYRASPPLYAFALGFAQRLPNGNTLITYGTIPLIVEVDQDGIKQWEAVPERFVYRSFKIDSLY